jgi:indole-3-glycerol phosphate synthase
VATYLDDILAVHRARAAADDRSTDALFARAMAADPARGFAEALCGEDGVGIIAEIKRRSPSKGPLAPDLDPATLARAYESGGASCLSVLTDRPHFGGSPADLVAARAAVTIPVLRKDFTVDVRDLFDARLMGADAALLIVAALDDDELVEFVAMGERIGLGCLVEVHDEAELDRAVRAGASIIGVNQRDLRTFSVDVDRASRLAPSIPDGVVRVAESGVQSPNDIARLVDAGFDAVLVGEALVTSDDPASVLGSFRAASLIGG